MESKMARDIMRLPMVCLHPEMRLDQVSDHLTKHQLPGAPVLDDDKNLIGFISEYDCLKKLMESSYYCDNTAKASDVMSAPNITTTPTTTLLNLAEEMNDRKVNVMPVVDSNHVVGVVARSDVMRALVADLEGCSINIAS